MATNKIFLLILLHLSPNKSPSNQYYLKSVPKPDILIMSLPKNDKIQVPAKNFIFDYFSYLSNENQFVTNICIKQIMHSFCVYNQSLTTASGSRLFGSVVRALDF